MGTGGDSLEPTSGRRLRGRRGWDRRWARLRAEIRATLPKPCGWCGDDVQPWDEWHLDHITPVAAGGTDTPDNVQPLHARCNREKAAQTMPPRYTPPPPSRTW